MERSQEGGMLPWAWEESKAGLHGSSDIWDRPQRVSMAWLWRWGDGHPWHRAAVNKSQRWKLSGRGVLGSKEGSTGCRKSGKRS